MNEEIMTYEQLAVQEFARDTRTLVDLVENMSEKGTIKFGPDFLVPTAAGENLVIATIFEEAPRSNPLTVQSYKTFILIAQTEEGEVIGHRQSFLKSHGDLIEGRGDISVLRRGTGVTIPLELAHFQLLQWEANRQYVDVHYFAENANYHNLMNLEKEMVGNNNPKTIDLLAKKREEQARWNSVYGVDGVLGFGSAYVKEFSQNFMASPNLERCRSVQLTRFSIDDGQGRNLVIGFPDNFDEVANALEFRAQRLTWFENNLLPSLKLIAQT